MMPSITNPSDKTTSLFIKNKKNLASSKQAKTSLTNLDLLWTLLLSLALGDVIISYFGNALNFGLLKQPWILITALFSIVLLFNIKEITAIKHWVLFAYACLLFSLLIGYFTIDLPPTLISSTKTPFKILPSDLVTMTVAFFIGALWIIRNNIDSKFVTDLFLIISVVHTTICVIALLKLNPAVFPIIDKPYFRGGKFISRPEITTDQTRQVLYLFINLCVIFTQKSIFKRFVAVLVSVAIVFILSKVQSRWSTIIFALFFIFALLMAMYYGKLSLIAISIGCFLALALIVWKLNNILTFLEDLIWRFQQVDSSYGGRAISVVYLFEKLGDPYYWIPHGYNEFFRKYGAAPHSFPTMVYLNAGLLGLLSYISITFAPLYILFKKVLSRNATEIERICFFCGSFAVLLSVTQPVIHHEIFWLIEGLVIGSISRKNGKQTLKKLRQYRFKN